MIRSIIHLMLRRGYVLLTLALAGAIIFGAILQGLGVGMIAPLLDSQNPEPSGNQFVVWVRSAFESLGIEFSLLPLLLIVLAILVLRSFSTVVSAYLKREIELRHELGEKKRLYGLLANIRPNRLGQLDFGNVIQVVQEETRLSAALIEYFLRMVSSLLNAAVFLLLLLLISVPMTIYAMVVLGATVGLLKKVYLLSKRLGREVGETRDGIQRNLHVLLYGYKSVRAFLAHTVLLRELETMLRLYKAKYTRLVLTEAGVSSIFSPLAIAIIISSYFIYSYTVAELAVFVVAIDRLFAQFKDVQNVNYKMAFHYASLRRTDELEQRLLKGQYEPDPSASRGLINGIGDIHLRGVSFGYESDQEVLRDVDLLIPKGVRIALVGGSGSGKSTLVDLLMLLHVPTSGKIEMDGILLNTIPPEQFLTYVGYVPQDPFMLNATVAENVAFYREATDAQINEALRLAHAAQFVGRLPQGIDTVIGEAGTMLSGGQRQRLTLARALLGEPQLLILDEATSALDTESETMVQAAIESLQRDVTVVIVAHRLSTVRNADSIAVLENGSIIEQGTYEELFLRRGRFHELASSA